MFGLAAFIVILVLLVRRAERPPQPQAAIDLQLEPFELALEEPLRETMARASAELRAQGWPMIDELRVVPAKASDRAEVRIFAARDPHTWIELWVIGRPGHFVARMIARRANGSRVVTAWSEQPVDVRAFGEDEAVLVVPDAIGMRALYERHETHVAAKARELRTVDREALADEIAADVRRERERIALRHGYTVRDGRMQPNLRTRIARGVRMFNPIALERAPASQTALRLLAGIAFAPALVFACARAVPAPFLPLALLGALAVGLGPLALIFPRSGHAVLPLAAFPAAVLTFALDLPANLAWAGAGVSAWYFARVAQDRARGTGAAMRAHWPVLVVLAVLAFFAVPDRVPRTPRYDTTPLPVRAPYDADWMDLVFADGVEVEEGTLRQVDAGELVLTTGQLVASDGLIWSTRPFEVTVAPGRYRVVLTKVVGERDERIAFARIVIATGAVTAWKACGDRRPLAPMLVDSGTGGFYDLEAALALHRSRDRSVPKALLAQLHPSKDEYRNFASVDVPGTKGANIVISRSGIGDGRYPVIFGYDGTGALKVIVADFGMVGERGPPSYREVIAELDETIATTEAYAYRAFILAGAGDFTGALADLDRAEELGEESHVIHLRRGELLVEIGEYDRATRACEAAFDAAGRLPASPALGIFAFGAPDPRPALQAEALMCSARVQNERGDHRAALESVEGALERALEAEASVRKASEAIELEARKRGQTLGFDDPMMKRRRADIILKRARLKVALGDDSAADDLRTVLELDRRRIEARVLAALLAGGDVAAIEADAIERGEEPQPIQALAVFSELPATPANAPARIAVLEKALKTPFDGYSVPFAIRATIQLSRALEAMGDRAGALRALDRAIAELPRSATLHAIRAELQSDRQRRIEDLDRAVEYGAGGRKFVEARARVP